MLIGPVVAPLGTVAVICVSEFTAKEAAAPLNATAVAPVKCEPLIVTPAPTGPLAGLNELIIGAEGATVTVKLVTHVGGYRLGVHARGDKDRGEGVACLV